MLATTLRRSTLRLGGAGAAFVAARGLCAPAADAPLGEKVRYNIATFKAQLEDKSPKGYTKEALSAALASGSVDSSLLRETLDFKGGEHYQKLASKMQMEMAQKTAEMQAFPEPDFSKYAGQISASTLGEIEAAYTGALSEMAQYEAAAAAEIAAHEKEMMAEIAAAVAAAKEEEKAAEAGLLECIAKMEALEVDIESVSSVTIGEILEREPEMRAEIEEELKNNVWAP